jgi:hypothetical protein
VAKRASGFFVDRPKAWGIKLVYGYRAYDVEFIQVWHRPSRFNR